MTKCVKVTAAIAGIALLLMLGVQFSDVLLRYLFGRPIGWAYETTQYLLVLVSFLPTAYALLEGAHVRVGVIRSRFPENVGRVLDIFTSAIGVGVCAVLSWECYSIVVSALELSLRSDTVLRVPIFIPRLFLVPAFILLSLQFLVIIRQQLRHPKRRGETQVGREAAVAIPGSSDGSSDIPRKP